VRLCRRDDPAPEVRGVNQEVDDMYRDELADFLSSVETGDPPAVGAYDAADALQVVEAARESARSGRVVELEPGDIQLRRARLEDADMILRWRNDPAARTASRTTHEIHPDEHKRWLERRLGDRDSELLIVEDCGRPIGQVRLDRTSPDSLEVSIAIDRSQRGRGLARQVLLAAINRGRSMPGVTEITAEIHPANERSQRAFRSAGFRKTPGHQEQFERWTFALESGSRDPDLG
jgi:RimJ/RimL family protein N-acetyltransferase